MSRWMILVSTLALFTLLAGCSNYDLTVNEKVVYTPRPLLADVEMTDNALRSCVEQAIIEQQVTRPNELITLDCSAADVVALDGLDIFTGLRELKLASNQISSVLALKSLSSLESLDLSNNQIVDPVPLYELLSLRDIDLSGNRQLQCPGGNALFQLETLILPAHCKTP